LAEGTVTRATAQQLMIRSLINREGAGAFVLTDQGRAELAVLLAKG
jgi:hypothetical protein